MATIKYFETILAAQKEDAHRPPGPLPRFDFSTLATKSALKRWFSRFLLRRILPLLTAILRLFWPNPRFGRVVFVTRRADAEEVLGGMDRFKVVYGPEMKEHGAGEDNVLSVDGDRHAELRDALRRSIRQEDIDEIGSSARADAIALLEAGDGRIDIMRDLVTRTATEACCRFFGLSPQDPDRFAEWSMAVSGHLFGDYFGDPNSRKQAQTAAAHLRSIIDDAISRIENDNAQYPQSRREHATLIDRLVSVERMPRATVRAAILGLLTAFVPTNTLAGGNMLELLFDRASLMRAACDAARSGNMEGLTEILLEAGRLNPALSPGLWRHVPEGAPSSVIGKGRYGAREVRAGDLLLACIPSALRDGRAPGARDAWLMFGHGPHDCLGAKLALAHLAAVLGEILKLDELRWAPGRHGRMYRVGPYPTRLDMTYRVDRPGRSLMVLTFPVRSGVARGAVEAMLDGFGNPVRHDIRASLDCTGAVQFASISVIEREPESAESVILMEISGDGKDGDLLDCIAERCFGWMAPLFAFCTPDGTPPAGHGDLARMLRDGLRPLHQFPWGSTGLHFDGLGELSVRDIERQHRVARFATSIVEDHLARDLGLDTRAMDILLRTRRLIKRDSLLALRRIWRERMEEAPERTSILRPSRKTFAIADWKPPKGWLSRLWPSVIAPDNLVIKVVFLALFVGCFAALIVWLVPPGMVLGVRILAGTICFFAALVMAVAIAAASFALFMGLVRWRELSEPYDDRAASLEQIGAIARREDAPGYAQNHIIAVMPFKRGLVRRLSFALAMWGIKQSVMHWFRPGFVVTMGTIHKARWFRVPGTNQFVFFSNYDGSWESYLEDFITRAHVGQSAAWSHGEGFPPTRWLVIAGAEDGDRFKRWVRRQQRETRCWYSRFPELTAQQIRRNAMIEYGLARGTSDTDARRWLANFGSAQRELDELETQEGQTILFNGFGRQHHATALLLHLPSDPKAVAGWLRAVSGLRAHPSASLVGPPARWLEPNRSRPDELHIRLPREARISFGEQRVSAGGALGLTAAGLERAGLSAECGSASLPVSFRMGMAARADMLGDDRASVAEWRFSDDPKRTDGAHAVLLLYGHETGLTHGELIEGHRQLLSHFDGYVCHEVPCTPLLDVEHFGFRDGISQPVIQGTCKQAATVAPRDIVPAGEFLLGYRNVQGFVAPAIGVGAEQDPGCDLPTPSAAESNRYPAFGNRETDADLRDFGRNGCFLAIRQLDQDVRGFRNQLKRCAAGLKKSHPGLLDLAGGAVSGEWLAAKIIGRWRDGSPLVGNADRPAHRSSRLPADNDFAYGTDDPQGLSCPLGAHIRRANPRDSQQPGDADEQRITNRHRLLRRGRSYAYRADGAEMPVRKGLLFIALCADLERQFEFVQRNWLNATSFHGLVGERDPLLGGPKKPSGERAGIDESGFTIPTSAGPVRIPSLQSYVTLRGGGYFFLPSRSALAFLINRSTRIAEPDGGARSMAISPDLKVRPQLREPAGTG